MKLLKVVANNFKLCGENFTISFLPSANKTEEDKEFEMEKIDDDLYVFNTIGLVGKNASGKSTVLSLLSTVYDIFSNFRIKSSSDNFKYMNNKVSFDISFYHEGAIYRYLTDLVKDDNSIDDTIVFFENQKLFKRVYKKTHIRNLFDYDKFEELTFENELPKDTSILYTIIKKIEPRGIYCSSDDSIYKYYKGPYSLYKGLDDKLDIMHSIINMLDSHIKDITMLEDDKFEVKYLNNKSQTANSEGLYNILSSGTSKGFGLFSLAVFSLRTGTDLIVDEIENHFHKTLVENLINLYKDKKVNKKHATLIFSTHNAELLDLFNCDDNIYISKLKNNNIEIENMHDYGIRPDLSKTNKFYQNAFDTDVDYDALMKFKKELL